MTQEEKQLLLKDLCARLPYGVKCQFKDNIIQLTGVQDLGKYVWGVNGFDIDNCKPYLRPMSSMTEEEKKEFTEISNIILHTPVDFIDWLNEHHFDHRELIEKGLALEAPEGMYKIDKLYLED